MKNFLTFPYCLGEEINVATARASMKVTVLIQGCGEDDALKNRMSFSSSVYVAFIAYRF